MEMEPLQEWTIEKLVRLRKGRDLLPDWEYQRGPVWDQRQARLFIDSVLRGYKIPLIYVRMKRHGDEEYGGVRYDIIDGQQRINALFGFWHDSFIASGERGERTEPFKPLFDPASEQDKAMFPPAMQRQTCAWAGKTFKSMSDDERDDFASRKLNVAVLSCSDDQARHLFIRLQKGSSLTPQEKRDAWPGDFGDKVIKLGGKPELHENGHDFFRRIMKLNPAAKGGGARKVAAQLLMTFMEQKEHARFVDLSSKQIDGFYRYHIAMRDDSLVGQFKKVLDKLTDLLARKSLAPLKTHSALHLIVLADMLMSEYSREWESGIASAVDQFRKRTDECKGYALHGGEDKDFLDIWNYYQKMSGGRSGNVATIRDRHKIYARQILRFLGKKAKRKDPLRGFTPDQRRRIYDDAKGICFECGEPVDWNDAVMHHKVPHAQGGQTVIENGALVHPWCHPGG